MFSEANCVMQRQSKIHPCLCEKPNSMCARHRILYTHFAGRMQSLEVISGGTDSIIHSDFAESLRITSGSVHSLQNS
jgi:hypothetical protein